MTQPTRFASASILVIFLVVILALAWQESGPSSAAPGRAASSESGASTPTAQAASSLAAPASLPAGRPPGTGPHAQPIPSQRAHQLNADLRTLAPVSSVPLKRPRESEPSFTKPASPPQPFDLPVAPAMPAPSQNFAGLSQNGSCAGGSCGAGWPPDTVGDVGPNHYIEAVNTAIGIYSKTGTRLAALTFNSLWSAARTGTACDANNQGDPTVLYDPLANRWIVADFAFTSTTAPPFYECIAVSKTGDPVSGGWYLYPLRADDAEHPWFNDYPKMGIWTDGIYMTANEFQITSQGSSYKGALIWALNRTQLEAGTLNGQVIDTNASVYSLLPANLRGALPPANTPEYLVGEDATSFRYDVYKLSVDWSNASNTVLSGPFGVAQGGYGNPWSSSGDSAIIPQPGTATALDSLGDRLMMQLQYRNLNGAESLWTAHTVRPSGAGSGPTGIQWAQLNVSGGNIVSSPVQEQIFTNGGDGLYRWVPSIAVDRVGNAAVGYTTSGSSAPNYPALRWAGRLATDPLGTLSQGEGLLNAGTGSQVLTCGGAPCDRWGDYSAMTVDPSDDCTFWYVGEYFSSGSSSAWQTRIGSFQFPSCEQSAATPSPTPSRTPTRTATPLPAGTPSATPSPLPRRLYIPLILRDTTP